MYSFQWFFLSPSGPGRYPRDRNPTLNRFDQMEIFFNRRYAVLKRQIYARFVVHPSTKPDHHPVRTFRAPVIGLEDISGIDLKAEYRPGKPARMLIAMVKARMDAIGNAIKVLTFRHVPQAFALRLECIDPLKIW
jgi:hypothetical protein